MTNPILHEDTIYIVDDDIVVNVTKEVFVKTKISCKSDSMGMILDCRDEVHSRLITNSDKVKEGRIYIYEKDGKEIIHRLVKCLYNCTVLVFKGDNNYIADNLVKRSQVIKEVVQIKYIR
tara:strand:+ start:1640 stop:1999 length:360 start_codon:yes stop_codon:yes gene_type:complete